MEERERNMLLVTCYSSCLMGCCQEASPKVFPKPPDWFPIGSSQRVLGIFPMFWFVSSIVFTGWMSSSMVRYYSVW